MEWLKRLFKKEKKTKLNVPKFLDFNNTKLVVDYANGISSLDKEGLERLFTLLEYQAMEKILYLSEDAEIEKIMLSIGEAKALLKIRGEVINFIDFANKKLNSGEDI